MLEVSQCKDKMKSEWSNKTKNTIYIIFKDIFELPPNYKYYTNIKSLKSTNEISVQSPFFPQII